MKSTMVLSTARFSSNFCGKKKLWNSFGSKKELLERSGQIQGGNNYQFTRILFIMLSSNYGAMKSKLQGSLAVCQYINKKRHQSGTRRKNHTTEICSACLLLIRNQNIRAADWGKVKKQKRRARTVPCFRRVLPHPNRREKGKASGGDWRARAERVEDKWTHTNRMKRSPRGQSAMGEVSVLVGLQWQVGPLAACPTCPINCEVKNGKKTYILFRTVLREKKTKERKCDTKDGVDGTVFKKIN